MPAYTTSEANKIKRLKMKAAKTKFSKPYVKSSSGTLRPALPFLDYKKQQSGVYLIKSERSGKIIYVGYSQNSLYKTIYRHFQTWKDSSRSKIERFTYNKEGYQVRIIFTTPARAAILEKYLIQKLKPRDNDFKYELYLTSSQEQRAEEILQDCKTVFRSTSETDEF